MSYLIKKIGFDNLENHLSTALYETIVGITETKEQAEKYIAQQKQHTYQGWDKNKYPYFTYEEIKNLGGK